MCWPSTRTTSWAEFTNWNIFFTLFLSLLAMYGLKERKWCCLPQRFSRFRSGTLITRGNGIIYMLIFYLCRNHPVVGAVLYCAQYISCLGVLPGDRLNLTIGGLCIDWSFFAVFAALLIFIPHARFAQNPQMVFYAFYPAHLALIAAVQLLF